MGLIVKFVAKMHPTYRFIVIKVSFQSNHIRELFAGCKKNNNYNNNFLEIMCEQNL